MNVVSIILITILLVLFNGYFVTAEFSLLRVRKTRLKKLFDSNEYGAEALKKIMKNLNLYVITSQIGITLTTLGIGFITLPYFSTFFSNIFGSVFLLQVVSFLVSLFIVMFIHTVIGEIAPKIIAIQHIETLALYIAPLLVWFSYLFRPMTEFYRKSSIFLLKLFKINTVTEVYSRVYSEDELKLIVAQSQEQGEIDESEEFLINKVLDFSDTRVNEIFTPRYEIVAFEFSTPVENIIEKARQTGYSRFPVYKDKLDQVKGFVHVKDLLIADHESPQFSLKNVLRPVFTIHEAMRLDLLLKKMQQDRSQVAIVVDEYGSVEGLVTIEDILEAIVGPIDDEFDIGSVELVKKVGRNKYIIDGRVTLDVFNQAFHSNLMAADSVTIAGFILEHLESLPQEGSQLKVSNDTTDLKFIVKRMDGNRVDKAQVIVKRKMKSGEPSDIDDIPETIKISQSDINEEKS